MRRLARCSPFALLLLRTVPALALEVTVSEPILVAEAPVDVREWGWYQFPVLDRTTDGRIALTFHVHPDSARSYGLAPDVPNRGYSSDSGKTWTLARGTEPTAGLLLPNGERLRTVLPKSLPAAGLALPAPAGTVIGTYGKLPYVCYRHDELPEAFRGVPLSRLRRGATQWSDERARLDDPAALRYTVEGVFPVVWVGDLHVAADGALLAVVYPGRIAGAEFAHLHAACYRSADAGHSWQLQGRIFYRPDPAADPHAAERDGFTEPGSVLLRDGSLLAVLRTTDGNGVGPMYAARSTDAGKTWSPPRVCAPGGVLPRLLALGNGVLVLSAGRPGAWLRFSADGRGEHWTEPRELVPVVSPDVQADTCGYTSLLPLGDDAFLVAYSWFNRPGADGRPHKSILVRRVTVRP
jgi:hypothetical protein